MNKWDCQDNFGEVKFELLALTGTKLKGNGEVSWCSVNGIIAGVQMERDKDVWYSAVVHFGCISSRIIWIKFKKFSRVKVCVVVGYGPNEGDGEERDRFWNDMDRASDSLRNGYRLCIPGDQNGWIGNRTRTGITSAFGVPGENDNGRRVVKFWKERGLYG